MRSGDAVVLNDYFQKSGAAFEGPNDDGKIEKSAFELLLVVLLLPNKLELVCGAAACSTATSPLANRVTTTLPLATRATTDLLEGDTRTRPCHPDRAATASVTQLEHVKA